MIQQCLKAAVRRRYPAVKRCLGTTVASSGRQRQQQNDYHVQWAVAAGCSAVLLGSGTMMTTANAARQSQEDGTSQCLYRSVSSIKNPQQSQPQHFTKIQEKYEIQQVLGEGSFGKVFLAKRITDNARVALKALRKLNLPNEEALINQECDIMTTLKGNPYICRIYDQHQDSEYYYVSMELCGESDLFDYLVENGPLEEKNGEASKYISQLVQALSYIHSKDLIHGDLKLENLIVNPTTKTMKVVDFGSAVYTTSEDKIKPLSVSFSSGTTAYLSPEMLEGRRKTCLPTRASDLYAAGIIMYICLTGSHPFDPIGDLSDEDIVKNILKSKTEEGYLEEFVFDEDRTGMLSPLAIHLLQRLLDSNPEKRITVEEFRNHPWFQTTAQIQHEEKEHRESTSATRQNEAEKDSNDYFGVMALESVSA